MKQKRENVGDSFCVPCLRKKQRTEGKLCFFACERMKKAVTLQTTEEKQTVCAGRLLTGTVFRKTADEKKPRQTGRTGRSAAVSCGQGSSVWVRAACRTARRMQAAGQEDPAFAGFAHGAAAAVSRGQRSVQRTETLHAISMPSDAEQWAGRKEQLACSVFFGSPRGAGKKAPLRGVTPGRACSRRRLFHFRCSSIPVRRRRASAGAGCPQSRPPWLPGRCPWDPASTRVPRRRI